MNRHLFQKRIARILAGVLLMLGMGLSLFSYLEVVRLEKMLKDQVEESFPNLGRIHRLMEVVQDTRRLLEQMSDLEARELEIEIQDQKKRFLDTYLESQSKRGSFILKSLKGDFFDWVQDGITFHQKLTQGSPSLDWEEAAAISARSVELHLKLERFREHLVEGHLTDLQEIRSSLAKYYTLLALLMGVQLALGLGIFYVLQREGAMARSEEEIDGPISDVPRSMIQEEESLQELREKDPWWEMVHSDEPIFDREKGLTISGGKETILEKVIESFESATPILLEDLGRAVETLDREKIEVLLHRLKGSARCVGGQRLAAWAESLEKESRSMKPVLLKRAYECVCDNFKSWQEEVEKSRSAI